MSFLLVESAEAALCPAHECSVIWGRSLITTAARHLFSSCDSLARCAAAPHGQNVGLAFLPVSDMLQVSGAGMVQHCSGGIGGACSCTLCGYLMLQGTLSALGFWNVVCGKYKADE